MLLKKYLTFISTEKQKIIELLRKSNNTGLMKIEYFFFIFNETKLLNFWFLSRINTVQNLAPLTRNELSKA
ncbi:hypothetical protein BpHYR1_049042 [Brachionus plicatilis]|uniref:Uncharacterized protein n=1 Tax=Brachionus plicatilis TaxID=10195 RepID=A0A3M7S6D2_BRAPC|nr:hypothetical protein BpHYR1_049042 [Brachionus plicatilis]